MSIKLTSMVLSIGIISFSVGVLAGRKSSNASAMMQLNDDRETAKLPRGLNISKGSPLPSEIVNGNESIDTLFGVTNSNDYKALVSFAIDLNEGVSEKPLLEVLFSNWAKNDADAALEYAHKLERIDLIHACLVSYGEGNMDEAIAWIQVHATSAGEKSLFLAAVYEGMSKLDAIGAVGQIEQMPASQQRDDLLSVVLKEWAKQDVQAAFDWIETAEVGPQIQKIYSDVMNQYIMESPLDAAFLIAAMRPCDDKARFASTTASELAAVDVNKALDWAGDLDHISQNDALQSIFYQWSSSANGCDALKYLLENSTVPNREDLLGIISEQLAQESPEALARAMKQMEQPDQVILAKQLGAVYAASPDRLTDWIKTLQVGAVRDTAIESALRSSSFRHIEQAFHLSQSLDNEARRLEQMREVITKWMMTDPAMAEYQMNRSTALSEEQKQNLLNQARRLSQSTDFVLPQREYN